jgi:hypothetical protein
MTTHHPVSADPDRRHETVPHTETHTFVNTSREFAMLLEVKGRTLKLVSDDYLAVAVGDTVRAVCEPSVNGPLYVRDWHNVSRSIRFRTIPAPLAGAATAIGFSIILLVIGYGALSMWGSFESSLALPLVGMSLVLAAAVCAVSAYRTAKRLFHIQAALDRLAR